MGRRPAPLSRPRPRSCSPGTVLGLPVAILTALLAPLLLVGPAAAQEPAPAPGGSPVTIAAVSPWVEADGVFRVEFEPGAALPPGSRLSYRIGQRLRPTESGTLREATSEALADPGGGPTLQGPRRIGVEELGDPAAGAVLEIPVRSGSGDRDRSFIPTAGVHPVDLILSGPDDQVLWEETVFLNRLPVTTPVDRDGAPATTAVQLLASLDSGPALSAEGTNQLNTQERAVLSSVLSLLSESADIPLTVSLRPNTLVALQRSDDPTARAIVELVEDSAWNLANQTYVRVDAAGLMATGSDEFPRQLEVGTTILDTVAGRPSSGLWMLDDTVDTEAARVLGAVGITHLLTSEDRVAVDDEDLRARLTSRTVALQDVEGVAVSTYDAEITQLLVEPETDPGLRAHRALTALMGDWFDALDDDAVAFPGVSAAVVLPPGVDPSTVTDLADVLGSGGPLGLAPPPPPTRTGDGGVATGRLVGSEPTDLEAVVERTTAVGDRIDGYAAMTGGRDPVVGDWNLANDQTPSIATDAAGRSRLWSDIDGAIAERVARIEPPPSRTIVLSGSGRIPLRFNNGLDTPVRLRMTTRSPRLDFPEGATREIVLAPGANVIDIPVEVRAPGSSLLRIELRSPDGSLSLPDTTVTVRSSSISGVGAALSALSLTVLAVWWIRTHRRRSRDGDDAGPAPSGSSGDHDDAAGGTVGGERSADEGTHG